MLKTNIYYNDFIITDNINDFTIIQKIELNNKSISEYINCGLICTPNTIHKDIFLSTLHTIVVDSKSNQNCFKLDDLSQIILNFGKIEKESYDFKEVVKRNRIEVLKSVESTINNEKPDLIYLSGGIDSTSIAVSLSNFNYSIDAIKIIFKNQNGIQNEVANAVSKIVNFNFFEYLYSINDFKKDLITFIWNIENLTYDGFAIFAMHSIAKKYNYKTFLTGLGGDELYGGYYSFKKIYLDNRNICNKFLKHGLNSIDYKDLILVNKSDLLGANYHKYYKNNLNKIVLKLSQSYFDYRIKSVQLLEFYFHLKIRAYQDIRNGYNAYNSNCLCPLLSDHLVDFVMKVPEKFFFHQEQNKSILRNSFSKIIPDEYLFRKKEGIPFPFKVWMKEIGPKYWIALFQHGILCEHEWLKSKSIPDFVNSHLSKYSETRHIYFLWRLIILEYWLRKEFNYKFDIIEI